MKVGVNLTCGTTPVDLLGYIVIAHDLTQVFNLGLPYFESVSFARTSHSHAGHSSGRDSRGGGEALSKQGQEEVSSERRAEILHSNCIESMQANQIRRLLNYVQELACGMLDRKRSNYSLSLVRAFSLP